MAEVPAGFLRDPVDAIVVDGLAVPEGGSARGRNGSGTIGVVVEISGNPLLPVEDALVEGSEIVVENADVDHALNHADLPVPVGGRAIDDAGKDDIVEHRLELLDVGIGPTGVGVADDLSGTRKLFAVPGGLEGLIGVGVALQIVAIGVEDADGVVGVGVVAGDVPEESLQVGGAGIVVSSGAADVGVRSGAALDEASRRGALNLIGERADIAVQRLEVGGVEGLVVRGNHDLDVIELGFADEDARVIERLSLSVEGRDYSKDKND